MENKGKGRKMDEKLPKAWGAGPVQDEE